MVDKDTKNDEKQAQAQAQGQNKIDVTVLTSEQRAELLKALGAEPASVIAPPPPPDSKVGETIPGGKYLLPDGKTWVNANGDRIDEDGKVLKG